MTHTSIFPGNREIVEIEEEELNPGERYRSNNYSKPESRREEDRRSLASNAGYVNTLEDDLGQLFEIFNRRTSHGSSHPNQAGTSKRNASKKPVKAGVPSSPGHGISERMNLKQALRGLCLSQASEMAAIKRSMKSPRSSEAGRILTMYRNVVVEDSEPDHSPDEKAGMLEFSLLPEESTFDSFQNVPEKLPASDLWPSNRTSLAGRAVGPSTLQNDRGLESKDSGTLKSNHEKLAHSTSSSSTHRVDDMSDMGHNILAHNAVDLISTETGNRASSSDMNYKQKNIISPLASSRTADDSIQEAVMVSGRGNKKPSFSVDFASQTTLTESSQKGKRASLTSSSRSSYGKNSSNFAGRMSAHQNDIAGADVAQNHKLEVDMLRLEESVYCQRYSADYGDKALEHSKSVMTENENISCSYQFPSQSSLIDSLPNEKHVSIHSSRASNGKTSMDIARKKTDQKEMIPVSPVMGNPKKVDMTQKEKGSPIRSPRRSDIGNKALEHITNSPASSKLVSKEAASTSTKVEAKESSKAVLKDSSMTVTSTGSPKGKKVGKSTKNAQHFVRPLIKTKNFVKRKSKKKIANVNSSKNMRSEFNNDLYSSPNPVVCPNCQCVVADTWKEVSKESSLSLQDSPVSPQESPVSQQGSPEFYQHSPISPFASLSGEVSSGNAFSEVSTPGLSSDGIMSKAVVVESSGNSKSKDKADFTQSSKGSRGECSSSTSGSEESNLSRPSVCDRPHMSKDARWEAIRHVKFQHGTIGLQHFNLLRKLGCGDIGTVYLAELVGTNCLFAIKVMDNEFLARRKKMARAQTEKEILRMLDHPFLPTLYCQFTSDNLSCLVMEYCPGGDLHVLRQKQPGRCFTEQAARFYVAEVLLALEYLHMLGVVYRDLKPENILVREDGHIMLSDFDLSLRCAVSPTLLVSSSMSESTRKGFREARPSGDSRCAQPLCIEPSCQVTCFTPRLLASSSKVRKVKSDLAAEMRPLLQLVAEPTGARSNSFVGTHEYLAPEIIKGDGHGSAVDWWTFGIFLFELLYGKTPFKGAGNEETLANVVLQSLKFPDSPLVSLQARELISALLVKEPENRLGTERGAADIKQHSFFDGLNWALIRCALPPELPESRSFGLSKTGSHEKNNKYGEYGSGSGSGSAEHLEFEVF